MNLYRLARKAKGSYKAYLKRKAGTYLSTVRRIEQVAPPAKGRFAAMTFDDGPTAMPTNPKRNDLGLTMDLLQTLEKYGAKGTFDAIGTTKENYPDEAGPIGSFTWGGLVYDHYPDIHKDELAGIVNQPELVTRILQRGHEITSHTFRHILFGRNRLIYGKRRYYPDLHAVIDDLKQFDDLMNHRFHTAVSLSRPPHYIDKTCDGHSAYDAYRYMNYQYMAASFDGGGWQVSGDYQKDVQDMIAPIKKRLSENPDSLNGQIIFQKDGCNMQKETPVADALDEQLRLLTAQGYQIITVSQLLQRSPFSDIGERDTVFPHAKALLEAGYPVAYQNNTLQPDRILTFGELMMMTADPSVMLQSYRDFVDSGFQLTPLGQTLCSTYRIAPRHPYFHAYVALEKANLLPDAPACPPVSAQITPEQFLSHCKRLQPDAFDDHDLPDSLTMRRRDAFPLLCQALSVEPQSIPPVS